MQRTTREQMIATVRKALDGTRPETDAPIPPAVEDALVRLTGPDEDLVGQFTERAEANGMFVRRCDSTTLADSLLGVLEETDAMRVAASLDDLPMGPSLAEAMAGKGVEVVDWRGDRTMANLYDVGAGITTVAAGLAETGTIICCSGREGGRGLSLVPAVHIAIVRTSDILPDMIDYMARQRGKAPAQLPASQSMITGPSKTADIEGVLITGVHGPGRVFILLVEE